MTGIGAKWVVQRYTASPGDDYLIANQPLRPIGQAQTFDEWGEVVEACDTIIGVCALRKTVQLDVPVVLKHGDDVVLIYLKFWVC